MIAELELAVLTVDVPSHDRRQGEVGTVVDVLDDGTAYLIEFPESGEREADVVPVTSEQVISANAYKRLARTFKKLSDAGLSQAFMKKYAIPRAYQEDATRSEAGADRLRRYLSGQFGIFDETLDDDSNGLLRPTGARARFFSGPLLDDMEGSGRFVVEALARAALSGLARPIFPTRPDYATDYCGREICT